MSLFFTARAHARVLSCALSCVLVLGSPLGMAQTAAPPTGGTGPSEPKVQQTVIEDDGARIDELKVRGHTQRIVVSPKRAGSAPYEIITGDGSRDLGDGANTSRGAAGKRVWNVLKF